MLLSRRRCASRANGRRFSWFGRRDRRPRRSRPRRMLAEELEPRTLLAAEIWLAPEVDATVASASPDEHVGDAFLVVSSSLWQTREAYLRFDLSLVPADFDSARLRLTTARVTGLAVANQLAFVSDNTWTVTGPGAINWTNKPAAVANAYLPSADTWPVEYPMTVELDVTELVEWSVTRGDLDADGDVEDPIGGDDETYAQCADRIRTALRHRLSEVLP